MGVLVETTDLDLVAHELSRQYSSLRVSAAGERVHLRLELDQLGPVRFDRISLGMTCETEVTPWSALAVGRVREGRLGYEAGSRSSQYGPGETFVSAQPGKEFRTFVSDLAADYVTIPADLIAEVTDSGDQPEPVKFTGYEPVSATADNLWNETFEYALGVATGDIGHEPLVFAGVARLLVTTALATFPNTARNSLQPGDRHDAHPAVLRRALAFIDENAQRDISPAEMAGAAYVSIRAVQLAFRRHLGITPMAYVRRVRLEHAHRELLAADPSRVTVSAVAARWGFANHSRFAAYYRAAYNCTPSKTLTR